jgi:hypothetical protein
MKAIRSSRYLRGVIAAVSLVTFLLIPVVEAATFQLPEGTEIKVRFNTEQKISSGTLAKGDSLMITLAEPISVGDQLLVAEGAPGKAVVTDVVKAGAPGKPGHIAVQFVSLGTRGGFKTADGMAIPLTGTVENSGKGKKLLAFVTIVGIFLIKGGQGELPADSVYTAKIGKTVVLTGEV